LNEKHKKLIPNALNQAQRQIDKVGDSTKIFALVPKGARIKKKDK